MIARDLAGLEQRRRAAAEEDGVGVGSPSALLLISCSRAATYCFFRSPSNRPRLKLQ